LAAVAVKYPAFQELGSEVLAVSVDSLDTHRRWQEGGLTRMVKGGALFPLCSDPQGEIGGLYGVFNQDTGVDARGTFLIDPEGNIQWIEISATAVGRNVPEILRVLRALQHQRATGALLPCGWQPGRPTLPAGEEEAGGSKPTWEIWETRNAF
jgi:alkyl hydroperoxide reductase subunit AhpC